MSNIYQTYQTRFDEILVPVARTLEQMFLETLFDEIHIDRISVRAKSPTSFLKKAQSLNDEGATHYQAPLDQIQDQIGARIIVYYTDDVIKIHESVLKYFRPIEIKSHVPENQWEFGYFGQHFILILPNDVWVGGVRPENSPVFFELQIKTLFQHAWSEANHDLSYKGDMLQGLDVHRKLALASAQAWGADQIFNDLSAQLQRNQTASQ